MSPKVFISSTCYDLIDLRAEIESFFRVSGAIPILSDSLSSEFEVSADKNSIETCLANVRACDYFIIILSRRYGPSLAKAGFEDISATHLEYRTAVQEKKPIFMYVRDRLEADRAAWNRNGRTVGFNPSWCDKNDVKLFDLIEEHGRLESGQNNNSFWQFRNSVELKQRLEVDFRAVAGRAIISQLLRAGRLPFLTLQPICTGLGSHVMQIKLEIRNLGAAVALHPKLIIRVSGNNSEASMTSLAANEIANYVFKTPFFMSVQKIEIETECRYTTLEGHVFGDEGVVQLWWDEAARRPALEYIPKTKRLHNSDGISFETAIS